MLTRVAAKAIVAVGLLLGTMPSAAAADPPISCPPGTVPSPRTGQCIIVVTEPGGGAGGGGGGGGGGGAQPVVLPTCTWTLTLPSKEVPCSSSDGWWVQNQQCYAKAADPQPPFSDPAWGGRTTGQIYLCTRRDPVLVGVSFFIWLATPPNGAPPDPRILAQQAMASMQLRAINIGLVPEPVAGSVGLVGMPNWMWVDAPTDNTWGPITRSASAAGYTVTATAKVSQVNWDMGDGQVVSCGAGTAYQDSFGRQSSPTCGHTYTRQGSYTVRATSHWVITWSGIGQSGTITMDLTDSVPVTIGEAQVVKQ